jgi:hypothetical protein
MDDEAGWQAKGWRQASLAGRTANPGTYLRNRPACFQQLGAGRGVNRAVNPATAEHPLIGGVDDRFDGYLGDVTGYHF